ncbi:hypothetical protein SXIM_29730 [Streptomyces xiamenensis]|uniref:Uncharacterized protein n=1 Tax=Streptomyces xiamenensis TaxID=408015 RepID=A0A0F7FWM6_9ACTN|nr:hypothetical protein SXIM_29730 [Streptomyces xiamenensis]
MRGGALGHHPLRHPSCDGGFVISQSQSPLRAEIVHPARKTGVTDTGQSEDRPQLLVRPALLPGHPRTPDTHRRLPPTQRSSVPADR